jgi:hypothetical protein
MDNKYGERLKSLFHGIVKIETEPKGRTMSADGKPGRPYWRHIVGWPLLILGIFGLALPFLQGILFIVSH